MTRNLQFFIEGLRGCSVNLQHQNWDLGMSGLLLRNGRHAEQARRCTERKQCKLSMSNACRKRARTTRIKERPILTTRDDTQPPIWIEGCWVFTVKQQKLVFFNIKTGIWECILFTSVCIWQWRNEAENVVASLHM